MSAEAVAWGEESSDAELITAARGGDSNAFGALYERHAGAARTVARQYTRSTADADDVVSDAFARVYSIVRGGGGPDVAFRAYLFTVVRRLAHSRVEAGRRVQPTDDMATFESAFGAVEGVDDPALAGFERGVVAKAYGSLPERWQAVLWYTEIERLPPAQVAPLLGLTANGVAALAYRAREGLREAYLQQHLVAAPTEGCRTVNGKLGSYVRGGLAKRETGQVRAHLETCEACRGLVLELGDVNHGLRGIIAPLVLGVAGLGALASPLPVGVLAAVSGGAAGGGAAGGAAGGGAAGGAAGGGAAGGAAGGGGAVGGAAGGGAAAGGAGTGGAATGGVAGGSAAAGGAGSVATTAGSGAAGSLGAGASTAVAGAGAPVATGGAVAGTAAGTTAAGTTAAGGVVGAGSVAGATGTVTGAVTGAATTGAVTTGAVTTGAVTTGAVTTGAATTGAVTSGAVAAGATGAVTTGTAVAAGSAAGATAMTAGATASAVGVAGATATGATALGTAGAVGAAGVATATGATAMAGAGVASGAALGLGGLIAALPGGVAGAVTAGVVGVSLAVGSAFVDPPQTLPASGSTVSEGTTSTDGGPGAAVSGSDAPGGSGTPSVGSPLFSAPPLALPPTIAQPAAPEDAPVAGPGSGTPDMAAPGASAAPPVAEGPRGSGGPGTSDPVPSTAVALELGAVGSIALVPGESTRFTVTIENSGETDATSLRAALVLPAGVELVDRTAGGAADRWQPCADDVTDFCLASLPGGTSSSLSAAVQVGAGVPAGATTIGVEVTAAGVAPRTLSLPADVRALAADLQLVSASAATLTAGDAYPLSFSVGNRGPGLARDLVVTVDLPAGVRWTGDASGGAGWTCEASGGGVTCRVPELGVDTLGLTLVVVADTTLAASGLVAELTASEAGGSTTRTPMVLDVVAPDVPPVQEPDPDPGEQPVDPDPTEPPAEQPTPSEPPTPGPGEDAGTNPPSDPVDPAAP